MSIADMLSQILLLLVVAQIPAATIQGIVFKKSTGEPLTKTVVELRAAEGVGQLYTAVTSDDGRFVFPNLQPGRYRLRAVRAGYVENEYKEVIAVMAGRQVTGIRFPMMQTAAIYGRVFDRAGQPAVNATVQALKATYPDGKPVLKPVQTAITNDLGEYRLFWLAPASYFVSALPYPVDRAFGGPGLLLTSGDDTRDHAQGIRIGGFGGADVPRVNNPNPPASTTEIVLRTYFPGTADEEQASAIELRPGANFGSADVAIMR